MSIFFLVCGVKRCDVDVLLFFSPGGTPPIALAGRCCSYTLPMLTSLLRLLTPERRSPAYLPNAPTQTNPTQPNLGVRGRRNSRRGGGGRRGRRGRWSRRDGGRRAGGVRDRGPCRCWFTFGCKRRFGIAGGSRGCSFGGGGGGGGGSRRPVLRCCRRRCNTRRRLRSSGGYPGTPGGGNPGTRRGGHAGGGRGRNAGGCLGKLGFRGSRCRACRLGGFRWHGRWDRRRRGRRRAGQEKVAAQGEPPKDDGHAWGGE